MSSACVGCEAAIELEEVALVRVDGAEVAISACDPHLERVVLALEMLESVEKATGKIVPPVLSMLSDERVIVRPGRHV